MNGCVRDPQCAGRWTRKVSSRHQRERRSLGSGHSCSMKTCQGKQLLDAWPLLMQGKSILGRAAGSILLEGLPHSLDLKPPMAAP